MTIDEMREKKRVKGYSCEQIAELSGVPLGTVQKIFSGETRAPRYATLQALERIFRDETVFPDEAREIGNYSVARKQGEYTAEDYYALPDERRAELIDGIIYDMSSPTFVHQSIVSEIHWQISDFIRKNRGQCQVLTSPVDVRLDCNNKTILQPDLLVLCDRDKIMRWGIMGAPDFVLEVLSPSTKWKDAIKKLEKYRSAGVREYWMIDPDKQKLIVYQFEEEVYPAVYGLEGKVPVGIYEGSLQIDMDLIRGLILDYPNES